MTRSDLELTVDECIGLSKKIERFGFLEEINSSGYIGGIDNYRIIVRHIQMNKVRESKHTDTYSITVEYKESEVGRHFGTSKIKKEFNRIGKIFVANSKDMEQVKKEGVKKAREMIYEISAYEAKLFVIKLSPLGTGLAAGPEFCEGRRDVCAVQTQYILRDLDNASIFLLYKTKEGLLRFDKPYSDLVNGYVGIHHLVQTGNKIELKIGGQGMNGTKTFIYSLRKLGVKK